MRFFLMVFDRGSREILELVEYEPEDHVRALADRFDRELQTYQDPDLEVVVLSAASLADLKKTHRRYFLGDTGRLAIAAG